MRMKSTTDHKRLRRISERTKSIRESGIARSLLVFERDPSVISLSAGEPDFKAPGNVIAAAKRSLDAGCTHYSPIQGRLELREAIAAKLKKENKIEATAEGVVVTSGSNEAILLAMLSALNPGDEVIVPDPGYPSYGPIAKTIEAVPVHLHLEECDGFDVRPGQLEKLATDKTKMLILNSPSNPTGALLNRKTLEEIADVVVEKDLTVLADEAYEKLVYDGAEHVSFASLNGMEEYTITVQTFSKSYAMTGFRVGYAFAQEEVTKAMVKLKICTTLSSPTVSQLAAIEALKAERHAQRMRREYDRRRKMVVKRLGGLRGVHFVRPKGAFYVFPNVGDLGVSSEDFTNLLLREAKVLVLPGSEFGDYGAGYVRMSYANTYEKIEEAMNRIEGVVGKI